MKRFNYRFIIVLLLACFALSTISCRARDCKGRRKTAKTQMGGWL
jgi:hypothetical protein